MRSVLIPLCILLTAMARSASAVIVASEGFESYTTGSQLESGPDGSPGTGLNAGSGFTGAFEMDDLNKSHANVAAQALSYSAGNVLVSGGANGVAITGAIAISNDFIARAFPAQSDTLYLSFLLHGTQTNPNEAFLQIGFGNSPTGEPPIAGGIAGALANTLPDQFFIRMPAASGSSFLPFPTFALDTTYLLVLKVSKAASTNYNRLDFFLNPTTLTEPLSPSLSRTADSTFSSLTNFRVRVARLDLGDTFFIDEVKVGTTYADVVVPEPSLGAIGTVGAFLLASRRRR